MINNTPSRYTVQLCFSNFLMTVSCYSPGLDEKLATTLRASDALNAIKGIEQLLKGNIKEYRAILDHGEGLTIRRLNDNQYQITQVCNNTGFMGGENLQRAIYNISIQQLNEFYETAARKLVEV